MQIYLHFIRRRCIISIFVCDKNTNVIDVRTMGRRRTKQFDWNSFACWWRLLNDELWNDQIFWSIRWAFFGCWWFNDNVGTQETWNWTQKWNHSSITFVICASIVSPEWIRMNLKRIKFVRSANANRCCQFTSMRSIDSFSSSSLKLVENLVSLHCRFVAKPVNFCWRGIIGVKAGDGIGVGNSRIGDRHLFIFDGTSSKMVGFGCNRLLLADVFELDLCALSGSSTGTSIDTFGKWYDIGESGAQLVKLIGVCTEDVDESSSPPSCGLDAVGVVDGDIISDDDICELIFVDA